MRSKRIDWLRAHSLFLLCLLLLAHVAYADDDLRERHRERAKKLKQKALEEATGVRITTPPPPDFFRELLQDLFLDELGDGLFLWEYEPRSISTFVSFSIPVENPCPTMIQMQFVKQFRFIKQAGPDYERHDDPSASGTEEPDVPPTSPGNAMWDPGELVSEGGGRFTSYDVPGLAIFDGQDGRPDMPATVTADRLRQVFKVEIRCEGGERDGEVVKRFYWMIETTIPYDEGTPEVEDATSRARQISSREYDNAEAEFGQDHS